ncbi:MAG: hypothetical protein JNK11_19210, partial [Alphaproteobacteria bacterium]|nr:hypothetical protein [Alphaproteobacteria bacterium]
MRPGLLSATGAAWVALLTVGVGTGGSVNPEILRQRAGATTSHQYIRIAAPENERAATAKSKEALAPKSTAEAIEHVRRVLQISTTDLARAFGVAR